MILVSFTLGAAVLPYGLAFCDATSDDDRQRAEECGRQTSPHRSTLSLLGSESYSNTVACVIALQLLAKELPGELSLASVKAV
jgi:hypothetical protein